MKWEGFIKIINKCLYTQTEKESGRVGKSSWKQLWKFQVTVFPLVGFPSNFFRNSWVPPNLAPRFCFWKFCLFTPPFNWPSLQNAKSYFPLSETFKLLLGCQYGHIIVRRIHTKVIRCVKIFLLLTSTRNTKDFAKIVNNLSFYFENLGTAIFKERLSVLFSMTKNFHCNLPFIF